MESKRQRQLAELVRRNFGLLLQQEGGYIYGSEVLVTVTSVKMTADLSEAKIYLSIYNTENKQAVMLLLEEQHFRLKQLFAQRLRKQVRRIPEFMLFADDTLDEMYRLNSLFNRLHQDKQMGEQGSEVESDPDPEA